MFKKGLLFFGTPCIMSLELKIFTWKGWHLVLTLFASIMEIACTNLSATRLKLTIAIETTC